MIYLKMPDGKEYDVGTDSGGHLIAFNYDSVYCNLPLTDRLNGINWLNAYVKYDGSDYPVRKMYPTY